MDDFTESNEYIKVRDAAARYLSYRARSRAEVCNKLKECEFDEEISRLVIERLEYFGYINDVKFCQMFIHDKTIINGFGSERIIRELKEKGVERDIIEQCVVETELRENDKESAYKLLTSKRPRFMAEERKRAIDFLLRKGYPYEAADSAFRKMNDEYSRLS